MWSGEVGEEKGGGGGEGKKRKRQATGCRLMDFPLHELPLAAVADSAVKLRQDLSLRRTTRRCRDPSSFAPTYLHPIFPSSSARRTRMKKINGSKFRVYYYSALR